MWIHSTRLLVLALALAVTPRLAFADTVFSEDFTDNDDATDDLQLMSEFSVSSTGVSADWHVAAFGGNQYARCNGFGADTLSDDWLFTPVMNLTGATTAAVKFNSAYNFTGPTLELKVSTNYTPGNNPSSATWTNLTFTEPGTGSYTFGSSGNVDLTAHISATTVVAWRYTSTGTGSGQSRVWQVDDVVVFTNGVETAPEGEGASEGEGEGVTEGEGEGSSEGESVGEGGMIISEYIEGTSNNKAIEIFNGKTTAESLTGYSLALFSNGVSTATVELDLTDIAASLPARGTLVIANSAANAAILAAADGTCAFPTCPITYNGNDAVALYKDGVPVDVVGVIGEDPGTAWTAGALSTQNQTLRRKNSVCFGNPDGFNPISTLSGEWNTFAVDTTSGLGSHSIDCTGSTEGEAEGEGEGVAEGEGEGATEGEEVECNEVFSEDFEGNFNSTTNNDLDNFELMTRVSVASAGNEANWHIFGAGGNQFARINGFGATPEGIASDDWLITPAMNLTEFEDAILTFDSAYNFGGPALEIKVSTNYNSAVHTNPGNATWTNLNPTLPTVGGYVFANSGDVSLSGHLGANTYVAFRYLSNGTAGGEGRVWEVDNVAVCGVPEGPEPPQYFSSITAEIGDNVCMTVPLPGTATNGDFTWTFTPTGGSQQSIAGESGITYCLDSVMTIDSGAYRATYDDGSSKAVVTYTFFLTVVENLPVGGSVALGLTSAAMALMGALGLRRRKP